ncbi:hypothetical protein B0H10DRAFT_2223443 [Mycena sp. CBHHK59/15]|nr:hypothetical protein B0H10DRAFT_2223443 [Mycena sp. CBHHK59/15]
MDKDAARLSIRRPRYFGAPNGRGGAESAAALDANAHLESLNGFGDRARPKQREVISDRLKASEVDGGLVGLTDAWLAASGQPGTKGVDEEEVSSGHTWGYQPKCGYPPRRLDKILTVGEMEAVDIKRIGVGLKLEDRDAWVSDHYGLLAKIILKP